MLPADLDGKDADRARLRDRLRVGLARPARRASGGDRQLRGAARDRATLPGASSGSTFPLIHGNAERVPLPDASFDLAISEYGASIWCDPLRVDPRGGAAAPPRRRARLPGQLRSGDALPTRRGGSRRRERLVRPQFGMHRFEWSDDDSVEFHLPHGKMIDLLRESGFDVEQLIELRPPEEDAVIDFPHVTLEWSRQVALRGDLAGAQALTRRIPRRGSLTLPLGLDRVADPVVATLDLLRVRVEVALAVAGVAGRPHVLVAVGLRDVRADLLVARSGRDRCPPACRGRPCDRWRTSPCRS